MVKSQEYINGKTIIVNGSLSKLEEIRLLQGLEFSLMPKLQMINIANSNFEDEAEGWKLERNGQKLTTLCYPENKLEKNTTFKNSLTKLKYRTGFYAFGTQTQERVNPPRRQGTTRESKAAPPTTRVIW